METKRHLCRVDGPNGKSEWLICSFLLRWG